MTASSLPVAVSSLAQRTAIGTSSWHSAGQLDLLVDAQTRVRMRPGRRPDSVEFEVRLANLPAVSRDCEVLLSVVMLQVTATAADAVGVAVLSADGSQILLQAEVDGSDTARFDSALEAFLNETDRWVVVLRKHLS